LVVGGRVEVRTGAKILSPPIFLGDIVSKDDRIDALSLGLASNIWWIPPKNAGAKDLFYSQINNYPRRMDMKFPTGYTEGTVAWSMDACWKNEDGEECKNQLEILESRLRLETDNAAKSEQRRQYLATLVEKAHDDPAFRALIELGS